MEKDGIVFLPTPGSGDGENVFVRRMIKLLSVKYNVKGIEQVSNDWKKIKNIKAVILNWVENDLDGHLKRYVVLYKIFGVKICWVFHNRVPHEGNKDLQIENMRWMANHSDFIFLLSKASKQHLPNRERNAKKCIYLPHINYMEAYPASERDIREENAIREDVFVFAFLGLIRPYKNLEILVQAFCELNLENAKLFIAGNVQSGTYIEELRKKCLSSDRVILKPGFISNGEMEAFIRASDVVVLPYSKVSSMNSGVMMMAFSYGRTVIMPDIAMGKDIKNKQLAFIYDYRDENENLEKLKGKMLEAYQKGKKEVHSMGISAKKYVKHNNSEKRVWDALKKAGI